MTGDQYRALAWARSHAPEIDSAPLFIGLHPTVIRAMILIAAGDEGEVAAAINALDEFRLRCTSGNYGAALARVNALLGVGYMKQGNADRGVAAMRESVKGGVARGFTRTYLDLLPVFGPQMRALAAEKLFPPAIQAAITDSAASDPGPVSGEAAGGLTEREREVLTALFQRLTYKEIAKQLFISPATVKRHASSIYSKLGVSGRTEAIRAARGLGWQG
jgi:LuxR family maltose regulon positive regulatory protein